MATPFAALEARCAAAVFKHMANATGTFTASGTAVDGILDAPGVNAMVGELGMASVAPTFTLPSASVPASPVGNTLVIGAVSYVVTQHLPDGTGVSTLVLERAS